MPGLHSAGATAQPGMPGAGPSAPTDAPMLAGRYELLEPIGGGAMGVVYRATDTLLGRTVAVKLLRLDQDAESSVLRFEREARAAALLSHPNIVSVFDAGTDGTTHFIVMEYVCGNSLSRLFAEKDAPTVAAALDTASQISSGLAAAHKVGVVHRDVKPSNVMIDEAGVVKLLDFGIARMHPEPSLTPTGSVLGSARYIAPEVARGEPADDRSDVYSFGCVLYESLAGRPPFIGESLVAVVNQHLNDEPRPLREHNPAIPEGLEELTMRMLAKRRGDRPRAADVESDLQPLRRAEPALPPGAIQRAAARAPATESTQVFTRRRRRPRPSTPILVATALILLVAGVLLARALGGGAAAERASGATRHHGTLAGARHHKPSVTHPASAEPPPSTPVHPAGPPKPKPRRSAKTAPRRHTRASPPQEPTEAEQEPAGAGEAAESPPAPAEPPVTSTSTPATPPPSSEPAPPGTQSQPPPAAAPPPTG
ncbi:MAG TPA: protein kinase [Solirubrobacteraceae bacterium]|nr:protein kinase [Solirubrobacteraceae bacterium]